MSRLKYSIVIPKFSIRGINNSIKSLKIKLINNLLNRSQTRYTKSGYPRPRRSHISRRTRARPTSGAAPKRAPATRRRGLYKATLTGAGCTRSRCTMARLCKSRSTIWRSAPRRPCRDLVNSWGPSICAKRRPATTTRWWTKSWRTCTTPVSTSVTICGIRLTAKASEMKIG